MDAKQTIREVKARRDDRSAAWKGAVAAYDGAVQARAAHVRHALRFIEGARRGQELGRLGGRVPTVLYQGAIESDSTSYPMMPDVRAEVLRAGNMSTSQGWWVTTQTDAREIHLVVSCAAWEFNALPQAGGSSSTHTGNTLNNAAYRWGSKSVQDFATLINNAARQYPAYAASAEPEIAKAAADGQAAHANTAAIEARLHELAELIARLFPAVTDDLRRLDALDDIGRFSPVAAQRKLLQGALNKELATYQLPAFDPGPAPQASDLPQPRALPARPEAPEGAAAPPPASAHSPDGVPVRSPGPADAMLEALERLAALHERGVLSDDEFAAQKARILGGD